MWASQGEDLNAIWNRDWGFGGLRLESLVFYMVLGLGVLGSSAWSRFYSYTPYRPFGYEGRFQEAEDDFASTVRQHGRTMA